MSHPHLTGNDLDDRSRREVVAWSHGQRWCAWGSTWATINPWEAQQVYKSIKISMNISHALMTLMIMATHGNPWQLWPVFSLAALRSRLMDFRVKKLEIAMCRVNPAHGHFDMAQGHCTYHLYIYSRSSDQHCSNSRIFPALPRFVWISESLVFCGQWIWCWIIEECPANHSLNLCPDRQTKFWWSTKSCNIKLPVISCDTWKTMEKNKAKIPDVIFFWPHPKKWWFQQKSPGCICEWPLLRQLLLGRSLLWHTVSVVPTIGTEKRINRRYFWIFNSSSKRCFHCFWSVNIDKCS